MIRKLVLPNGWYSDLSLQGDWVSLIRDSHIQLIDQRIELPHENVLGLRLQHWNGNVYLAGQGNQSGQLLFWTLGVWEGLSSTFGTNVCAFWNQYLYIVDAPNQYRRFNVETREWSDAIPLQIGSQGIRYINQFGSPITGDSTYGPQPYNIAQFTELESQFAIGQGYNGGAIFVDWDHRYVVEPGDCEFIHAYKLGDDIAFCITHPGVSAVFYWMNRSDLSSFPLEPGIPTNPPATTEPPPITTEPPPVTIPPPKPFRFPKIKEAKLMDPEVVALVDPAGGLYLWIDGSGNFHNDSLTPWYNFEVSKPDDRFAIKYNGKYLGADGTQYSPEGVCNQLGLRDSRGNYESWFVGVRPANQGNKEGLIEATIEYITQGVRTVPFCSIALTVKRNV